MRFKSIESVLIENYMSRGLSGFDTDFKGWGAKEWHRASRVTQEWAMREGLPTGLVYVAAVGAEGAVPETLEVSAVHLGSGYFVRSTESDAAVLSGPWGQMGVLEAVA